MRRQRRARRISLFIAVVAAVVVGGVLAVMCFALIRAVVGSNAASIEVEATFSGEDTSFAGATFSGEYTSFAEATFSGETSFAGATFSGEYTSFAGARFSGERTSFTRARFSGERTSIEVPRRWQNVIFDWDNNLNAMPACIQPRKWPPPLASDS
jgi:Pentapeptide repeats (9 copies)